MTIRLELQGGDNAANALDLNQLKDLTQNMHVSDLLGIVKAHKAADSVSMCMGHDKPKEKK